MIVTDPIAHLASLISRDLSANCAPQFISDARACACVFKCECLVHFPRAKLPLNCVPCGQTASILLEIVIIAFSPSSSQMQRPRAPGKCSTSPNSLWYRINGLLVPPPPPLVPYVPLFMPPHYTRSSCPRCLLM